MPSAGAPRTATLVLVAALAALSVSATWAFARSGDRGWGMSRFGPGMMGYSSSGGGEPVRDLAGAKRQAERFAERLDLRVGEVMRFENNYDAELVEPGGEFGTEVLVNPTTGAEAGTLRAGQADTFPGYYTIHALEGDRVAGMLSVNAYTGAVWYHWWHGRFLSMIE